MCEEHSTLFSLSHLFTGMSMSDMYFSTQLMIFFRLSSPNSLEIVCRGGEAGRQVRQTQPCGNPPPHKRQTKSASTARILKYPVRTTTRMETNTSAISRRKHGMFVKRNCFGDLYACVHLPPLLKQSRGREEMVEQASNGRPFRCLVLTSGLLVCWQ